MVLVGHHILVVHQADGVVLVENREIHARDDIRNGQRDGAVHQRTEENGHEFGPFLTGNGDGQDGIEQADKHNFAHIPQHVAGHIHRNHVAGLVHHDLAYNHDEQAGQGEQDGEQEEIGISQTEPDIVRERDTHQQEYDGKEGRECHGRNELVFGPQESGKWSFFGHNSITSVNKDKNNLSDFTPYVATLPPRTHIIRLRGVVCHFYFFGIRFVCTFVPF